MSIPRYAADAPAADLAGALEEAGCLVVTGLLDAPRRQTIRDELAPHMAAARVIEDDDAEAFYPGLSVTPTILLPSKSARHHRAKSCVSAISPA